MLASHLHFWELPRGDMLTELELYEFLGEENELTRDYEIGTR